MTDKPAYNFNRGRKPSPSVDTARRLQQAFDIFNHHLFQFQLPDAMLKLERLKNANGIYRPARYSDKKGSTIACIALNSTNANERELHLLLSTLVHEMCHMHTHLITNLGKATGGHGVEWRRLMTNLGLPPLKIGSTWRQSTHTIDPDGLFIQVYKDHQQQLESLPWKELANDATRGRATGLDKVKFTCPSCGSRAWARASAELLCGDCSTESELVRMLPEYRAEGGGGKGSTHRAKAKPASYDPPSTSPALPVWTDELGRALRNHCGLERPPQNQEEALLVMLFGVKRREPQLFEDFQDSATSEEHVAALKAIYRHRARVLHPDAGGHEEAFKVLQIAYRMLCGGKG